MLKIPLLVSLGHHGGRRKVASLRPPFSTPLRSLGEPDPETPFLVPIEHAPPLFVFLWEIKFSNKNRRPPQAPTCNKLMKLQGKRRVPGGKKALAKLFKKPVKNAASIAYMAL